MPDELRLEVTDYTDLTRWRWVLTDADGAFLAGHEVRLDPGAERFEAFTGLQHYADWHAAPDQRPADEARIVADLGDWIGTEVFGPGITRALLEHRPATVQVILPAGAGSLAYLPLEAARLQGQSLAACDITLVIRPPAANGAAAKAFRTEESLRVLGLFSLPEGGTALNLRRERQSLVTLISRIAAAGRAADVKALQYGVTRARLRSILQDGEGWDVIHISGHGVPGRLVLEAADGRPDLISAEDLADLLGTARDRVQLVTVSACWSAARAAAGPRRLLGLPAPEDQRHLPGVPGLRPPGSAQSPERIVASPPAPLFPGDIATTLASRLGCAVLAMRFPVDDEFAIELAEKLYALLVDEGRPLPDAVGMTLRQFTGRPAEERFPALSIASPAIFGATATELTLKARERTAPVPGAAGHPKMTGFPPQPGRFVGRTAVMTRASAALAAESGIPGVLLHGMPGGGKTACALELAHTHEDAFDKLIWFKAPDEGMEISGSLTDFALALERDLPGLQMIDKVVTEEALTAFLPKLTELMERNRFLLVIDNAESLLTDTGQWLDEQWGKVVAALTGHTGLGRLIMTSRRVFAETRRAMARESVDALSADEALLLIRELPHMRALVSGELDGLDQDTARNLALGVLNIAQGHPKLLELADGQAANPGHLATLIQAGGQAWQEQGTLPGGFFTTREASAAPKDYLHVVASWTNTVTDTLSPGEKDLFWFLCCLEEPNRIQSVLNAIWPFLWQELGRDGDPPTLDQALTVVTTCGLTAVREGTDGNDESYALHPGVATAGRDRAGPGFLNAFDSIGAMFWEHVYRYASGDTGDGTTDTGLMVRAGLAAVPHLTRRQEWGKAAFLLHNAFIRDPTRANAASVLPAIENIVRHEPRQAHVLAMVLQVFDAAAAEKRLRTFIGTAADRSDYRAAAAATGELVNLCKANGQLVEALDLTGQMADYTLEADLGPWTRMFSECLRLQVLIAMGQYQHVFDELRQLRNHMNALPASPGPNEDVFPWHVREGLLDIGCEVTSRLGLWQDALDFNAEMISSMRDRRAPGADIARTLFNGYGPLLELGRTDDAFALLLDCRQTFLDIRDFRALGATISALADIEDQRSHGDAAIRLARDALRYAYLAGDVIGIAVRYHNLGNYLLRHTRQPAPALVSHLTAALVFTLTGANGADDSVHIAAAYLLEFGSAAEPPADIADLCLRLGDIPGTDPAALIAKLSPDPETAERTLQDLIAQAQVMASNGEQAGAGEPG